MASTIIPDPDLGKVLLEQKPTKGIIGNLIFLWLCGLMTLALGVPALVFMPVSSTQSREGSSASRLDWAFACSSGSWRGDTGCMYSCKNTAFVNTDKDEPVR